MQASDWSRQSLHLWSRMYVCMYAGKSSSIHEFRLKPQSGVICAKGRIRMADRDNRKHGERRTESKLPWLTGSTEHARSCTLSILKKCVYTRGCCNHTRPRFVNNRMYDKAFDSLFEKRHPQVVRPRYSSLLSMRVSIVRTTLTNDKGERSLKLLLHDNVKPRAAFTIVN